MTTQPKISIIIPVYNAEEHIQKCIESIVSQNFLDFECLVINDGSTDNSIKIAKEIVQDDNRFIFFEKNNGGQSSARNLGLDHIQGGYISFIDSDDYISPDFLSLMYNQIIKDDADICVCNVACVDFNGNEVSKIINNVPSYYEKDDYYLSHKTITSFMCDKLFKSNVFSNLRFNTNLRTHEDIYIAFEILYKKKITQVDKALYKYLQRPGSVSKSLHPTTFSNRVKIKNKYLSFYKKNRLIDYDYLVYTYLRSFVFNVIVETARYSKDYKNDVSRIKNEIDSSFFNTKNILKVSKETPKIGFSLMLFKLSPNKFRLFTHYWFRKHAA